MDLIDIDQVLDNLEMRAAEELKETPANCSSHEVQHRNFVGVSQVFTHLDDYTRNVEALGTALPKYDIECPLPKKATNESLYATTASTSSSGNFERSVLNSAKSMETANQSNSTYATSVASGTADSLADDDEEEASNDINKFTEEKIANENSSYDDEASSDSLTTSSSSTFSSGPSAGAASTTDERLSPMSPTCCDATDTQLLKQQQNEQVPESVSDSNINVGKAHDDLTTALDDIATGLSSISVSISANSQSIVPCETTTASSALHKVLDELSDQSSISNLSRLQAPNEEFKNEEANKNKSLVSAIEDIKTTEEIESKVEAAPAVVVNDGITASKMGINAADAALQPVQHQQQPITFTSTMDEISDTELDSMLQEMDIDADAAEEVQIDRHLNELKSNASQKMAVVDEELAGNQTTDSMNADSFSQASTVEFSEIRAAQSTALTQSQQQSEDVEHFNNSFSSSESTSLDGDEEQPQVAIEGEDFASGEENEHNHNPHRPQRPTTLDLPASKLNIFANAGQTPPGLCDGQIQQDAQINNVNDEANVNNESNEVAEATGYCDPNENLGRVPPIWVPDNMATGCMQCHTKFSLIKRRHHCRACGKVLCSVCCSQKFKLEFLSEPESRVCVQCYLILSQRQQASDEGSTAAAQHQQQRNQQAIDGDGLANQTAIAASVDPTATIAAAATNPIRSPNPNNPMEYCSTIPPHRQVSADASSLPPPTVIVPVGVLKKDTSHSSNSSNSSGKQTRKRKSVMFSDGIAPGSDLAGMEQHQWGEAKHSRRVQQAGGRGSGSSNKPSTPVKSSSEVSSDATTLGMVAQLFRGSIPPIAAAATVNAAQASLNHRQSTRQNSTSSNSPTNKATKRGEASATLQSSRARRNLPPTGCDDVGCFIPATGAESLPPLFIAKDEYGCEFDYKEISNNFALIERLQNETLKFAVTRNFFVFVKILNLKCCLNRTVINFTTNGMHHVGNDEIIILLEYELPKSKELMTEPPLPKDIFVHLHEIYREAELGSPICELAYTSSRQERFLGSQDYGGFIFIRPTFQCLQDVILPENPFLIAILIHRTEVPWAKVFPLRLMLRLGAQYRYYPCPHVSMRQRESVYAEIAQTIINILADFRNYSYTLPNIRGMYIHMEDRQTTIAIPRNRQEDVIKAMNDWSDHILAFGGNFSKAADGHLVCMQNTNDDRTELYSYSTQAINIQGQPRKITGASFFVLNESLKSTSGLLAKCSIVEDGLMVQILPSKMAEVRTALSTQKDIDILCGPVNAEEQDREIVSIKWVENDKDFNVGVKSPIDDKPLEGISSMRVHANFNYANTNYSIRLTEIFILKYDEWYNTQPSFSATSADITRISEQVARSTSLALIPFLDLLAASGNNKLSLRATLHQDNVCYEAGARGSKLPPLYMNALDNHLIPTLHNESTGIEDTIILELFFYILSV